MSKRSKLILVCFILAALVAVFAGCNRGGGNQPAATPAPAAQATPAPAADPATPAADPADDDPFAVPVHFTFANLADPLDFDSCEIFQMYSEKFNFTWEVIPLTWDAWGERVTLWIAAGDMPDVTLWNWNFAEYMLYVSQGAFRPLPYGWYERFPNLASTQRATGAMERVQVNGRQYILPRVTFYHFAPIDAPLYHGSVIYRRDWAEALGVGPWECGDMVSLEDFKEYLYGAMNHNPDGMPPGSVTGFSATFGLVARLFVSMGDAGYNTFYQIDANGNHALSGEFVWGAASEGTLRGMHLLRDLWLDGYVDQDFFMTTDQSFIDRFHAGLVAAFWADMTVGNLNNHFNNFYNNNPDLGDPEEIVGLINILSPFDNRWHGTSDPNNWSAFVFNPDVDDVTMERILAIFDHSVTFEQQEILRMGIEGRDWQRLPDGNYEIIRERNPDGTLPGLATIYPAAGQLAGLNILGDDFSFANPATRQRARDVTARQYQMKELYGNLLPLNLNWVFWDSPARRNMHGGATIVEEMVRVIVSADSPEDMEAQWQDWLDAQMWLVQPLLDELNAEFN